MDKIQQQSNMQSDIRQESLNKQVVADQEFIEYPYRWVIVALTGMMLVINGLANNTVIPIASKLAEVYDVSDSYVSAPIIISFLVYSIVNFPANHLIDTRGLRFSFLIGSGFYMMGIFLYAMINKGYQFTIFASICVAIGQPFIINCPAKVATYWFFDKNRPLATAIMTGLLLVGTGFGFILPTLVVKEKTTGDSARQQIFYLYACQFAVSAIAFVLIYLFMKKEPPTPPSIGAEQKKTDVKQSLKLIKKNKNLWVFFGGYFLVYGTLLSFGSTVNLVLRPYGYKDVQIAMFALILIVSGVAGSIAWSIFLEKTIKYRFTIRAITSISLIIMIIICISLNAGAHAAIVFILGALIGLNVTPLLPVSYDLGCELCFPIGQAQVIGILNGGAMILTFLCTLLITATIGYGTRGKSLFVIIAYISLMGLGTILYYFVRIDLKRRNAEQEGHTVDINMEINDEVRDKSEGVNDESTGKATIEMVNQQRSNSSDQKPNYIDLMEQKQQQI